MKKNREDEILARRAIKGGWASNKRQRRKSMRILERTLDNPKATARDKMMSIRALMDGDELMHNISYKERLLLLKNKEIDTDQHHTFEIIRNNATLPDPTPPTLPLAGGSDPEQIPS